MNQFDVQTILVTGGAGAIGTHLCHSLLAKGYRVVVLDDFSSPSGQHLDPQILTIKGSVTSDQDLARAFQWKPTMVIHMAALFANQNSVDHPLQDLTVNGMGTLKVLELCRIHNVKKALYFSSSCVYGPKHILAETDNDFYPETPYAITKLLGEQYCQFWAKHHGLNVAIVRVFNTFGPGELPGKYRNVIPNFLKRAMEGLPLPITGDGQETRSFIYVEDTVRAVLSVLFSHTETGVVYNIGSDSETRIIELAEEINRITSNRAGVEFHPRRNWDTVLRRRGKTEKLNRELGFKPTVSLIEGLERTYQWLKQYGFEKDAKKDTPDLLRVSPGIRSGVLSGGEDPRPSF